MEYTILKLAKLSGVSTRTLRFYDELGLLRPARVNTSGYRLYGQHEVDRLQQILFYRALGMKLTDIADTLAQPGFDHAEALRRHRAALLARREEVDRLLTNVERSLNELEGGTKMTDNEKFEGFRRKLIDENEKKYGKEIRAKYGDEAVNQSYQQLGNMTEAQYREQEALGQRIIETLLAAQATGDPAGPLAQEAAALHRQWLAAWWGHYSPEAHAGVAQMYVDDPRFTAYYDAHRPGLAAFLRDAVVVYTGQDK